MMSLTIGALALGILAWLCAPRHAASIQAHLLAESERAVSTTEWRPALAVSGRDIVLRGVRGPATEVDATKRAVAGIWGVRDVKLELTDPPPPAERAKDIQTKVEGILRVKIVEFETAKADLTPVGKATLDEILPLFLGGADLTALVEGHTDSRGNATLNQQLSLRRAQAVRQYMASKGVAAARLTAAGFGSSHPVADNATPEGRQRNRRIEFKVAAAQGDKRQ